VTEDTIRETIEAVRVPIEVVRVPIIGINLIKASVLPTLGKTFQSVRRKNLATEKKIQPPTKFDF
jgi:hypothetical protein